MMSINVIICDLMFFASKAPWRRPDLFFLIHKIQIKIMHLYVGSPFFAEWKYTVFRFIEMETKICELYLLPNKRLVEIWTLIYIYRHTVLLQYTYRHWYTANLVYVLRSCNNWNDFVPVTRNMSQTEIVKDKSPGGIHPHGVCDSIATLLKLFMLWYLNVLLRGVFCVYVEWVWLKRGRHEQG